jgi:hypothetical protein
VEEGPDGRTKAINVTGPSGSAPMVCARKGFAHGCGRIVLRGGSDAVLGARRALWSGAELVVRNNGAPGWGANGSNGSARRGMRAGAQAAQQWRGDAAAQRGRDPGTDHGEFVCRPHRLDRCRK